MDSPPSKIKKTINEIEFPTHYLGDEHYDPVKIIKSKGFRWVLPYYFIFQSYTKKRWIDKPISKVYSIDFGYTLDEVINLINIGRIRVFDKIITPDFILKDNMIINTLVHRHEFPVPDVNIEIIHQDENIFVINKPAGIPVHPSGRFRHNSVVYILQKEYVINKLFCVHRLDRFTSGILIFAKSSSFAEQLSNILRKREVKKIYLCKVKGEFPDFIICDKPLTQVSFKFALCLIDPEGKVSKTIFKRIGFDGEFSYIACYPKTGRMHQIRVHLQYLGFPIIGDYIYNHPTAFGPEGGKGREDLKNSEVLKSLLGKSYFDRLTIDNQETVYSEHKPIDPPEEMKEDPVEDCKDCQNLNFHYPGQILHLHSYFYKFDEYEFVTKKPDWFTTDGEIELNFNFD